MLGSTYKTFEHNLIVNSIEEAIETTCPYCGTELEWDLRIEWNSRMDLPFITAEAFSCGVKFEIKRIETDEVAYLLLERNEE